MDREASQEGPIVWKALQVGLASLSFSILLAAPGPAVASGVDEPRVGELMAQIERAVPRLLEETGVQGASVGLVHQGRLVYSAGFGWADAAERVPVRPSTLFNVGSISKSVTAWGVMVAVEEGAVDLDSRIVELLPDLELLHRGGASEITVEQLLGHTSGLSTPSVPEYLPWERRESVRAWLVSPQGEVHLASPPGEAWSYSGAGYALLQLVLEEVSGEPFADSMEREVLRPLDMARSDFRHPSPGPDVARPHAAGRRIPYRRYPASAAAGLYSSSEDLVRFLLAHTPGEAGGDRPGLLSDGMLGRMQRPRELSWSPYGTGYGLGYAVWPLATGALSTGHRGQNHGWSALLWLSPDRRDGLVVLTNDSEGEALYRPIFCEWARWLVGEPCFGRYCSGGGDRTSGEASAESSELESELRAMIGSRVGPDGPGLAALVARRGEVLAREALGLSDVGAGIRLSTETPFYVASLAKPITAGLILDLVGDGRLALDDRVDERLPELPGEGGAVTVRQLLQHTSGMPDFWELVDWREGVPADNEAVFELVGAASTSRPSPGARFEYSNTGYLALASLAERVTGKSFATLLAERWPGTPASSDLFVLDDPRRDLPQRARGYVVDNGTVYLSDYRRLEVPGKPPTEPGLAMVGAGGLVSTLDGLHRWVTALVSGDSLASEILELALAPGPEASGLEGLGVMPRATLAGLLADEVDGRRVLWQDGALFGHRSLLLLEPTSGITVILLANDATIDLRSLVREILPLVG